MILRVLWWQRTTEGLRAGVFELVYGAVTSFPHICHVYVMWAELGHYHFLNVPAVLKVVTTGNGTGTKNVFKWKRVLGFEFSILWRYYCSKSKPILYLNTGYCKFLLYVSVEIDPFSCEQTSAI